MYLNVVSGVMSQRDCLRCHPRLPNDLQSRNPNFSTFSNNRWNAEDLEQCVETCYYFDPVDSSLLVPTGSAPIQTLIILCFHCCKGFLANIHKPGSQGILPNASSTIRCSFPEQYVFILWDFS